MAFKDACSLNPEAIKEPEIVSAPSEQPVVPPPSTDEKYGPWMLVTRQVCFFRRQNRFGVLEELEFNQDTEVLPAGGRESGVDQGYQRKTPLHVKRETTGRQYKSVSDRFWEWAELLIKVMWLRRAEL